MLQFDESNINSLCGPEESVDLQTFYSISRETFIIVRPVQRWEVL